MSLLSAGPEKRGAKRNVPSKSPLPEGAEEDEIGRASYEFRLCEALSMISVAASERTLEVLGGATLSNADEGSHVPGCCCPDNIDGADRTAFCSSSINSGDPVDSADVPTPLVLFDMLPGLRDCALALARRFWNQICTARSGMSSCSLSALRFAADGLGVSEGKDVYARWETVSHLSCEESHPTNCHCFL